MFHEPKLKNSDLKHFTYDASNYQFISVHFGLTKRYCITTGQISMAPVTAVYYSSNFVILKFYPNIYFSDTEACHGLHLFPLCDMMNYALTLAIF